MPAWLNNAVFYEIYPQSFNDTNADGIGDFKGIAEKLDYIKELGCNALWINPCYASPFVDAGYDISDYYTVAPRYGTNQDLKDLIDKVHEKGMHILLDLVPGHTSDQHPWFKASSQPVVNEMTDRYVWTDSIWTESDGLPTIRAGYDRDGSAIVNFFSCQPALNYGFYQPDPAQPWQQAMDAPGPMATREALKDIMRFWLGLGADGFRVDLAGTLVKNDPEGKGTIALWQDIRSFLNEEFPEAAMVSEWGEPDKSLEGGFHMDFLLHFGPSRYTDLFRCEEPFFSSRGKGDVSAFLAKYQENADKTGGKGLICIPSGNHDMDRLARHLNPEEQKVAFAFLLTMPGAPFIYYGDEIGMRYVEGLPSKEGGFNRTGSRTPMQWDHTPNAGFSCAPKEALYLPVDAASDRPTVENQKAQADSLYHEVQRLIALRMAHPALQADGTIEFVSDGTDGLLSYLRTKGEERLLVIINPADQTKTLAFDAPIADTLYALHGQARQSEGVITIDGCTAVVLALNAAASFQ